jgi:CheY-like chemotaxis protein
MCPAPTPPTVLLVDDDPGVRRFASTILSRQGYRVLVAADGAEALALANSTHEPIDLVLTDMVMPGVTGKQLAERLLDIRPDIRILFMSGNAGRDSDDARIRGTFLAKPFSPIGLLDKLRDVLQGPPYRLIAPGK